MPAPPLIDIMKLTPLGVYVNELPPGGCNSAYLAQSRRTSIALDFGNGASGQLARIMGPQELDSIVVSHMHADHYLDLIPLAHSLLARNLSGIRLASIPLYLPPGGKETLLRLCEVLGLTSYTFATCRNKAFLERLEQAGNFVFAVFDVREVEDCVTIGDLTLTFFAVRHPALTQGVRVTDGESTLVYSSDTCCFPELPGFVRGADLFLCECTLGDRDAVSPIHLSARQAAQIARQAKVGRLVLTHFDISNGVDTAVETARQIFPRTQAAQQLEPLEF